MDERQRAGQARPVKVSKSDGSKRQIFWRTVILMALCGVVFFVMLVIRLWNITIVLHDEYQAKAAQQRSATIQPSRSGSR